MNNLADIYSLDWFRHDFAELGPEFDLASKGIARMWDWTSVLDVGCGPGLLLEGLYKLGFRDLYGIEGSPFAIEYAKERAVDAYVVERIRVRDICDVRITTGYGLVICTEVLEHIDDKDAETVVDLLASSATGPLIITAAPPGQEGHHHVNCQPADYWLDLFSDHAMRLDKALTEELAERWQSLDRLSHMRRNLMVLT